MHFGKIFTAALCLNMGEDYRIKARLAWTPEEANSLNQQAFERFWGALATGEHSAARYLSDYYSMGIGIKTPRDVVLSETMRRLDHKFASHSPDALANPHPGLPIIVSTVAEVYALKAYDDVRMVQSLYLSNHKAFTEREVKDNIARLWDTIKIKPDLACKIHKMLEKDPLYAYPFEKLVERAIYIERGLPKNPDFHLSPGYCSAKEDNIPTIGDNTKDGEDV